MRRQRAFILIAILVTVQLGCAGSMKGVVRRDAKRIELTYTDSRIGVGVLRTVLPDGERFEGKVVRVGAANIQSDTAVTADGPTTFEEVKLDYI